MCCGALGKSPSLSGPYFPPTCRRRGVQRAKLPVSFPFLVSKSPLPRYMRRTRRQRVCPSARAGEARGLGPGSTKLGAKAGGLWVTHFPGVLGLVL